jgi:hypothetical protein
MAMPEDSIYAGERHIILARLRAQDADRHEPVRLRYLEALAARMPGQPEPVRQALARKFDEAAAECAARIRRARDAMPSPALPPAANDGTVAAEAISAGRSPLAMLNREIQARAHDVTDDAHQHHPAEMKSVRRFAETWSSIATERQLAQALTRGPEAAGPLNSHNLMLRAMSLMHGLSPDYLRRFLAQADALLWLDHMNQQNALSKDGKPARRTRAKK